MITWVLGRSGTGKTTWLREQLPAMAETHQAVWYLVPEQSSMMLERELSRQGPEKVQVVSFRRLCNVIFRRFGGVAGTYMTRSRETALIYRVLTEQRAALRYYRTARPTMGFVARLADVFSEFTLSGLEQGQVLPLLEQHGRPDWLEKYKDLFLLYDAYRAALNADCRSAAADLTAATDMARAEGFFCGSAVVIDGFFGFTGQQRELLSVIMQQAGTVCCALLTDAQYPGLLFSPAQGEQAALQRLASQCGQQTRTVELTGPSKRLRYADLQALEARLFSQQEEAPLEEVSHIRLLEGKNPREELSLVAADIARRVREEGKRYRDFALITGTLEHYGRTAEAVFAQYGVPLFIDRGREALSKPLFVFVQSALRLISPERYFRQEDMMTFLKTGLTGEDPDLISRLEHYSVLWQINGARWLREESWTQNPKGLGAPDEEAEAQLRALNALRDRIAAPLRRFRAKAEAGTGVALAEAVYGLLTDFQVEERIARLAADYQTLAGTPQAGWEAQQSRRQSREYLRLYSVMIGILEDIHSIFGDRPLSLNAMEELIGLCGEETRLNVVPPTMDAVTFGEAAHSRLDQVEGLYVVGANQGNLPVPVSDTGLIGDRERRLFAAHALPCNATLQQNTLQGQYRLYAALFSAQSHLTFSYSAFQMDGEALLPSVYIDRLRRLTGLTPLTRADLPLYDFATTKNAVRTLMGWEPALRDALLAELGERPLSPRSLTDRLPEAVTRRLFGKRLRLSYSQISLYQNCPFRYFMEKTMRLQPLEPITFDAANIGSFVHLGLQQLVDQVRSEHFDYNSYTPEHIKQFGEELAHNYLEKELRDLNRSRQLHALMGRMVGVFRLVAENVLGELKEGRYVPYGEEVPLSGFSLPLSEGRSVELIGSVDRVDVLETPEGAYLKVTDYKTGRRSFHLQGLTNRDGIQLPLYLYGLMKSGRWENPIPAAACYMEARPPFFDAPVAPGELPEQLRKFYRRGGVITTEQTALDALDAAGGSHYFQIVYTKSSGLNKRDAKAYDPALMREMVDYMETVVTETAEGILAGEAAIHPLKGDHDGCGYCKFAAVCRFDPERDPSRTYSREPFGWRKEKEQ